MKVNVYVSGSGSSSRLLKKLANFLLMTDDWLNNKIDFKELHSMITHRNRNRKFHNSENGDILISNGNKVAIYYLGAFSSYATSEVCQQRFSLETENAN